MLTVTKLKTLLAPLAEPTRVYFQKEDKSVSKRRKQAGGSGARRFTEGWVEFVDKKTAKRVARTLHMTNMEKKGRHADDLWCLKVRRRVWDECGDRSFPPSLFLSLYVSMYLNVFCFLKLSPSLSLPPASHVLNNNKNSTSQNSLGRC